MSPQLFAMPARGFIAILKLGHFLHSSMGTIKRLPTPHTPSVEESRRYGPGDVIADKYQLLRSLGQGGMGTVGWLRTWRWTLALPSS